MSWHDALTSLVLAELCHSAGDHGAALERLEVARRLAPLDPPETAGCLSAVFARVTSLAETLNRALLETRNAPGRDFRRPAPAGEALPGHHANQFDPLFDFYSVARMALDEEDRGTGSPLRILRDALVINSGADSAAGLAERFAHRAKHARHALGTRKTSDRPSLASIAAFADAGIDSGGLIPGFVLAAFYQAHVNRCHVEHRRSGPVGRMLSREPAEIHRDRILLEQSVALLTFCYAICQALPWLFAAGEARASVRDDARLLRHALGTEPARLARQVLLLSLHRRAQAHRLLGDFERAHNDQRKMQRIAELTTMEANWDDRQRIFLGTLDSLGEYEIGELYRADHSAMQALIHLMRSDTLFDRHSAGGSELMLVDLKLSLGDAFLEIGAVKRALKWFCRAWISLGPLAGLDATPESVVDLADYLEYVKHSPELDKDMVRHLLRPAVAELCASDVPGSHAALAASIVVRIASCLLVIGLEEERRSSDVETLLRFASHLDPHNLLAWTGLLHCELRGMRPERELAPDPMDCWVTARTDVDQGIRVSKHLMLAHDIAQLSRVAPSHVEADAAVAKALLGHFHSNADSIDLRLALLHRYLMKERADEDTRHATPLIDDEPPGAGIEFVCLRRYSSFQPLLPRPAAVSAVGGGYLVRVFSQDIERETGAGARAFNILVDPGDGVISNLYSEGFAISDIDMIVATHDHPDHLSALDAILALRYEYRGRVHAGTGDGATRERMLILGNRSVVNRYSFLNGDGTYVVQHIGDASPQKAPQIHDRRIVIRPLPTRHPDLGHDQAAGFILEVSPPPPASSGSRASAPLTITFMSDTAIQGLGHYRDRDLSEVSGAWRRALRSDVVVAHISDAPRGELRDLAQHQDSDAPGVDVPHATVARFLAHSPRDAQRLMDALSLIERRAPSPSSEQRDVGFVETMESWDHLYLHGLLAVSKEIMAAGDDANRLLVVGEFREGLGSFRGAIAGEINRHLFRREHGFLACGVPAALTADVGLRIRLGFAATPQVHCSTCALNNDSLDRERYHPAREISEVCVKGDHEATYWNCRRHDPNKRERPVYMEQMGRYDPLAAI